jgi:restriction system protein
MAVPDFQTLMLPLLELASDGQRHNLAEAIERMAQEFQLSDDDRAQLLQSGQTRLYNRVGWATTLRRLACSRPLGRGASN